MPFPRLDRQLDLKPGPPEDPRTDPGTARVAYVEQRGNYWCWAACLVSVIRFEDPGEAQAELVSTILTCLGCFDKPLGQYCDEAQDPDDVPGLWTTDWAHQQPIPINNIIGRERLISEIDDGRPIHVVYERHAVMVDGWKIGAYGTLEVHIMDPQDRNAKWLGISNLESYGSAGSCVYSIYNIEKEPEDD